MGQKDQIRIAETFGLAAWSRLGSRLLDIPYPLFVALATSLVFIHTGFRLPWQPDDDYFMVTTSWPGGSSWDSSILWSVVPERIGLTKPIVWNITWSGLALATVITVAWRTAALVPRGTQRHFLLTILASGVPLLLASRLGFYDIPFLLGVVIVALFPPRWWIIGVVIVAGSNAEMGIVAGLCALLVGLAFGVRSIVVRSLMTVIASFVPLVLLTTTQALSGGVPSGSRIALLRTNAISSFTSNLPWLPLLISTLYLGAWIIVLLMITSLPGPLGRVYLVSGLVVVPLAFSLVTLDGTRVAVASASLGFLFATHTWFSARKRVEILEKDSTVASLGVIALLVLALLPSAVSVFVPMSWEGFFAPWESWYQLLQITTG